MENPVYILMLRYRYLKDTLRRDAICSQQCSCIYFTKLAGVGSEDASKFDKFPATSSLVSAHIVDWSKEPYIKGAYSYPSLGAKIGDR